MEKQIFNEKMKEVAELLGYTYEEKDDTWSNHGYLIGQSEIKISVRNDNYSHRGRIAFSSIYPRGKGGYWAYSRDAIEITVAESKTPKQITRDIQKRFLPVYLENLKKVIEANQQADDYEARKLATIKKVADYLGEEIKADWIYPTVEEIYKIQSDGNGFLQLEIRHCTPEKAIDIIEVLRKS